MTLVVVVIAMVVNKKQFVYGSNRLFVLVLILYTLCHLDTVQTCASISDIPVC